jgi:hypothetical protein
VLPLLGIEERHHLERRDVQLEGKVTFESLYGDPSNVFEGPHAVASCGWSETRYRVISSDVCRVYIAR